MLWSMTLRRKITLQLSAMLLGLLLVSAAALWGLNGLHQDYGVALEGYQRLRQVYEAASHLRLAQRLLTLDPARPPHPLAVQTARDEVRSAATAFQQISRPAGAWETSADQAVRQSLSALQARITSTGSSTDPAEVQAERDAVDELLSRIPALASSIRTTTEASQRAAQQRRHVTILVVGSLCAVGVAAMVALSVMQYASVIRPLRRFSQAVRRIAAGQFHGRIEPAGGDEFATLAGDFNRMAGELDGFYHELEQKVAEKSRELIRSERLASVGFLAAGVAHEINNPLGIISGYAEYSLAELRQHGDNISATNDTGVSGNGAACNAEMEKSLQIIRDEAFRCKEITGKLLSLAAGGDENRRPVSLPQVAEHVASMVRGLQAYRDRRLVVEHQPGADLTVSAVEAEIKQVLLNLTINALEAVPAGIGQVHITLRRERDHVEVSVADNGRGMTPQTLERVFEPFFTEKRGRGADGQHGVGLGLSITHAIVVSHGGSVEAFSEGLEKGSRFVVRLPALKPRSED